MKKTNNPQEVDDLRQQTVSGIGWTSAAQVGKQGVQFIVSVILARLLSPEEFGLLGMVIVFTGFAVLFGELGLGAALIQREILDDRHYSSVFWLNLLMGLVLTMVITAAGPLISAFYNEPKLIPLTSIIATNFTISALGLVQRARLSRSMSFRLISLVEMFSVVGAGALAIILAWLGYGVWSLGWQIVVASMITTSGFWYVSEWRPRLSIDWGAFKDLFGFSSNLLGFNAFNYWARNADNLLVGRFLGTAELGVYTRAYTTMLLPIGQVTNVVSQVMFPALSRVQHDKERVKRIYLRSIAMIALISFPMMMGLLIVADHFVLALYGPKWEMVTSVLQILCLVGMVQSIVATVGWIYQSQGRTDWMFKWGLFVGIAGIISFTVGVYIGSIEAVALCYAIANLLLLYWNFSIPGKLIALTFSEVVWSVAGVFGCAVTMAAAVWMLGLLLPDGWPHPSHLLIKSLFGIVVYGLLIHLLQISAYAELKSLLIEQWRSRRL
jgi:O-antigen/teichoic acid export membrane protein